MSAGTMDTNEPCASFDAAHTTLFVAEHAPPAEDEVGILGLRPSRPHARSWSP